MDTAKTTVSCPLINRPAVSCQDCKQHYIVYSRAGSLSFFFSFLTCCAGVHIVLVTDFVVLLTERDQKFHLATLQDLKVGCVRNVAV
jgi:hypothetical protein